MLLIDIMCSVFMSSCFLSAFNKRHDHDDDDDDDLDLSSIHRMALHLTWQICQSI